MVALIDQAPNFSILQKQDLECLSVFFDVTPARLVTGLITERGICEASEEGLTTVFPEFK